MRFENEYENLSNKVDAARKLVVDIHKAMNQRDSTIVKNVKE